MKQAIGGATVINIVIIFIIIIFALLAATFSYAKAYKVNTRIMNGIEIYEGYNDSSASYINNFLVSMGYKKGKKDCPLTKKINGKDGELIPSDSNNHYYCVYKYNSSSEGSCYYSYAVVTYISFDLPIVGKFDIPISSKTNRIYNFSKSGTKEC